MFKLSAFADEISKDLAEQIRVCRELKVTHIELRGVYGKNVMEFDADLQKEVKAKLTEAGMGVSAIGSPIGKVPIDTPWAEYEPTFRKAVQLAEHFGTSMIRVFSYYDPKNADASGGLAKSVLSYRDEVVRRFRAKLEIIGSKPITLVHENEAKIYGEKGKECLDLMQAINAPKLRMAFDFANFVQAGEKPLDNWPMLKPFSTHIHVKDAILGSGKVVPAGQGDGQIEPVLIDLAKSNYNGFLVLEPHLAAHGQFSGFSGPDLFTTAANALKDICRKNKLPLAGI